ncbi:MAG: ATP-binding protein [Byssovorax sp.]
MVIIDDSPDDRAEVRRLLLQGSRCVFDFVEATTGAAGVRAILDAPEGAPDCVILDYRLPDIDAPEVLAEVLGADGNAVCPVVIITGDDSPESGRAVLWAGAHDYVGKAWMTGESLTRAVENAMERWAMTRELRASEGRLRLALEASRTGIWTHDLTSETVTWSPDCYAIYGVAEGSFDGAAAGFYRLVHPDDRERLRSAERVATVDHAHYRVEFRVVLPGGAARWVESLGRASYDSRGAPLLVTGTVTNIDERKRVEAALNDRTRELLKRMSSQAQRTNERVDELVDAAQLQAGMPLSFQLREMDLVGVTRALVEETQQLAPEHRIELELPAEVLVGMWDPKRIERVVANLLSNAVKYSPAGGTVRVALSAVREESASWAVLRIRDEGMGIPVDDLARIFHVYSRVESARRATIEGMEIGLAGARDIVEQHGGSITVESTEGRGSTFIVKLPLERTASPQIVD